MNSLHKKSCYLRKSLYDLKPYGVGTQKYRLIETLLLSNHTIGFNCVIREILLGKDHQFSPPYLVL